MRRIGVLLFVVGFMVFGLGRVAADRDVGLVPAQAELSASIVPAVYHYTQAAEPTPDPGWVIMAIMVLQVVVPLVFRTKIAADLRKMIPLGNGIVSFIVQFWAIFTAAGAAPATGIAPAALYMQAGLFATLGNVFLDSLVNALLQTAIVTGAHSGVKNTAQAFKRKE